MKDFLDRLSRGEYGLAKTFWQFGILVGILSNIVISVLDFAFGIMPLGIHVLIYAISTAYIWYLMNGIWRAAENYVGKISWAKIAAKLYVIVSGIVVVAIWILILVSISFSGD